MLESMALECPCCGESFAIDVDTSAGAEQEYVEDCPVCCRPMALYIRCRPGTVLSVSVSAE